MFRFRLAAPAIRRLFAQKVVHVCQRCTATAATSSIRGNAAQAQAGAVEKQRERRILRLVEQKIAHRQRLEQEARLLAPRRKKPLIWVQHSLPTKNSRLD